MARVAGEGVFTRQHYTRRENRHCQRPWAFHEQGGRLFSDREILTNPSQRLGSRQACRRSLNWIRLREFRKSATDLQEYCDVMGCPAGGDRSGPSRKANSTSKSRSDPMKRFMTVVFLLLTFSLGAFAAETQLEKATNVLNEVMDAPDRGIPHDLFEKAVCVGIVPSELKGAFLVGGTYGRGVLVCREHGDGPWGAPSMFTMGAGSIGFQIGGEATDVVFIVRNEAGARTLVQDSVKLGGDLSVTAGPVGRTAEGATDAQLHAEILSYSRTRGLFAGVSLDGAVIKQDREDNRDLYGRKITAREILIDGIVRPPAAAEPLDRALTRYSPRGGRSFASL